MNFLNSTYDNGMFVIKIRGNTDGVVFISVLILLLSIGIGVIILALRSTCLYILHCECLRDSSKNADNHFPDISSRSTDGILHGKQ